MSSMLDKILKIALLFVQLVIQYVCKEVTEMTLGDLVKAYREKHDLSMDDFGKICGISRSYISLLEKNINPRNNKPIVPTLETFSKISKAMGIDLNELLSQLDSEQLVYISPEKTELEKEFSSVLSLYSSLNKKNREQSVQYMTYLRDTDNKKDSHLELAEETVPYVIDDTIRILGQTAAGSPISYADEGCFTASVSNIPQGADYALVVNGDSMEPLIPDHSLIYIHKQEEVENGTIAVVEVNGAVTCKKFYKLDSKLRLVSLNKKYEDMIFENGEIRVLGKVILP